MILRRHVILLATLLVPATGAAAQAEGDLVGFQTPSRNIACRLHEDDGRATLRCDITETETEPNQPADCKLAWGHSFEMTAKGEARGICAGDRVYDPRLDVLGYDETWQRAGFSCRSAETGLTCFNTMQHGFSLSRAAQKVF